MWLIKYLIELFTHKKLVFIECYKEARKSKFDFLLFWHGVTHDLSKLLPCELIPYARWFYGKYGRRFNGGMMWEFDKHYKCKEAFDKAWLHHYTHNKHHWKYWAINGVLKDIPCRYLLQMLCDLRAMGISKGNSAQEYYLNNYTDIYLTYKTRLEFEMLLDINDSPIHNYGHTLEDFANIYDRDTYDNYFGWLLDEYGVDTYSMLNGGIKNESKG